MNIIARFLISVLLLIPCLLISQAPVANFSALIDSSCGPTLNESFTDLSTNNPTHWKWYFPGAIPDTSTRRNPGNILYNGYGCYNVKLVVSNQYGSDSLTKINCVCLDSMPKIVIKGLFELCQGRGSVIDTVIVNGDTTYYNISSIVSATYIISVHNGACYKDTSLTIHVDTMPIAIFKGDTSICKGNSTTIYALPPPAHSNYGFSYLWSTGSTTDSIVVNGIQTGLYTYNCIITKGSCEDSGKVSVDVRDCTGIENYSHPSDFIEVYPNPGNGVFQLEITNEKSGMNNTIEIYNVLGEKVYDETLGQAQGDNTINISGQPNGVYLYRVLSENGGLIGEGRLVIQR